MGIQNVIAAAVFSTLFDVSYTESNDVIVLHEKIPLLLNTDYLSVFLLFLFPQASSKVFEGDRPGRARAIRRSNYLLQ